MRFLANENVPGPVVAALRERGHDVAWIKESMPGAEDPAVLALAQAEQRVVVTSDTDFGELAYRSRLPAQCGVVLLRIDWTQPDGDNQVVVAALTSRDSWSGLFAVVERDRVRLRPLLPPAATP
jgi:predicted nuclease of predicted toxin-antitoxin system